MTIGHKSGTVLDASEIRETRTRIVALHLDGEDGATWELASFLEWRRAGEEPHTIDEHYLSLNASRHIGTSRILGWRADHRLDHLAHRLYGLLDGHMDRSRAMEIIRAFLYAAMFRGNDAMSPTFENTREAIYSHARYYLQENELGHLLDECVDIASALAEIRNH